MEHLRSQGIEAEPFLGFDCTVSGVDHTKWTYDLDRGPGSDYRIGEQLINIQLSYHMLFRVMSHLPDDAFLILEDDVRFNEGWKGVLHNALAWLPTDWQMFFLGSCCCAGRPDTRPIGGNVYRVKYALCLHALAVNKTAIPILMAKSEKVWAPADIAIAIDCMPRLNCYAILPRIAIQHGEGMPE